MKQKYFYKPVLQQSLAQEYTYWWASMSWCLRAAAVVNVAIMYS